MDKARSQRDTSDKATTSLKVAAQDQERAASKIATELQELKAEHTKLQANLKDAIEDKKMATTTADQLKSKVAVCLM